MDFSTFKKVSSDSQHYFRLNDEEKVSLSSHFEPPRINFQIRISKSPWEVRIHQNPTRKETRDSRGTYAMRCSNSGDLWCHSLNSADPNDDFLSVVPGDEEYFRYVRTGDVQHGLLDQRAVRHSRELKRDSPAPPPFLDGWPQGSLHTLQIRYIRSIFPLSPFL